MNLVGGFPKKYTSKTKFIKDISKIKETIEKKDIKALNRFYQKNKKKMEYYINVENIVAAMLSFDKDIICKIVFDQYYVKSTTRYVHTMRESRLKKIKEAFNIIIKNIKDKNITDIVQIIFDAADNTMLIDIICWLIEIQNVDFLATNEKFIKKLICECQQRGKNDALKSTLLARFMSGFIINEELINSITFTKIFPIQMEIIFCFKAPLSLEEINVQIRDIILLKTVNYDFNSVLKSFKKNIITEHVINWLLEVIKKQYGMEKLIMCYSECMSSNLNMYISYENLYFILTKLNIKEYYNDVTEYIKKNNKADLNTILNNIMFHLINIFNAIKVSYMSYSRILHDHIEMMPYIMILMKKLNIKLNEKIKFDKNNIIIKRYVILSTIHSEYYNESLYTITPEDKIFFDEKDKKRTKILTSHLEIYVAQPIIHMISQYVGYLDTDLLDYKAYMNK